MRIASTALGWTFFASGQASYLALLAFACAAWLVTDHQTFIGSGVGNGAGGGTGRGTCDGSGAGDGGVGMGGIGSGVGDGISMFIWVCFMCPFFMLTWQPSVLWRTTHSRLRWLVWPCPTDTGFSWVIRTPPKWPAISTL
jgi:hypothetical protein